MIPVKGIIIKEDQDGQGAAGILVALASEFWGLGCPEIYNEVATRLKEKGDFSKAMTAYLSEFVIEEKILPLPPEYQSDSGLTALPKEALDTLTQVINYAKKFSAALVFPTHFQQSYLWAFKKLMQNCCEGMAMINKEEVVTSDEFYLRAIRCIENVIEHLLVLQCFITQNNGLNNSCNSIDKLAEREKLFCQQKLKVADKPVQIYFTDSGQQALIVPLMIFGHSLTTVEDNFSCVHLHGKTYFELNSFLADIKKEKTKSIALAPNNSANIVVVDVSEIDKFDANKFPEMKYCLIDITHAPDMSPIAVKENVKALLERECQVIISCSNLKHEQLGQDKFQSGKIMVISSSNNNTPGADLLEELSAVSKEAMSPVLADCFNLFHDIGRESDAEVTKPRERSTANKRVSNTGMFKVKKVPKNIQSLINTSVYK